MPNPRFQQRPDTEDASLRELMRRFAQDAGALVQQEIALAKLELRETLKGYLHDSTKLIIAGVVGLFGVLALFAALIAGLGALLDNYWLSALIVAVVFFAVAGVLARGALAHLERRSLEPKQTVASIKEIKKITARRQA
jgi:uncharacterized membrane protein YqjE